MKMAEHQRIALWTPLRGAAVFGTVSSSMPDVLRFEKSARTRNAMRDSAILDANLSA
jgi:hypothetical protein